MTVHLLDHPPPVTREVSLHGRWQAAWQQRAACAGHDTDEFFPEKRGSIKTEVNGTGVMPLLRRCFACPVRRECLEFALQVDAATTIDEEWGILRGKTRDDFGIFGGSTPAMRRKWDVERIMAFDEWEAALMMSAPISEGVAA